MSGSCPNSAFCLPGTSYCDFDVDECLPIKPDGDACSSDSECSYGNCGAGVCGPNPVEPVSCEDALPG